AAEAAGARAAVRRVAQDQRQGRDPDVSSRRSLFGVIDEALAAERPVALVTIVRAQGSTPQRVGARMLVFDDGTILGTIGGGCYEQDAAGKARLALATGRTSLVRYDLNDDFAEERGLVCGGQMDVFIDPLLPTPRDRKS